MMTLPPANESWLCGQKWVDGQLIIDPKKGCGQRIYKSKTETYASGKPKVLNDEDGKGGKKHDPHVCPVRFGSQFDHTNYNWDKAAYHKAQENLPCPYCGGRFNSYKFPLCPVCHRLACRKCDNYQVWINKEGIRNDICSACGNEGMDVVMTEWVKHQ